MQIPRELPQFDDHKTLIVVSGAQEGILHVAHNGVVEEYARARAPEHDYSDNEGHFKTRGGGETLYSTQIRNENEAQIKEREYFTELKGHIDRAIKEEQIERIYFYIPSHVKHYVTKKFGTIVPEIIAEGNYVHQHLTELLKKV
jgi:hypothetical protein